MNLLDILSDEIAAAEGDMETILDRIDPVGNETDFHDDIVEGNHNAVYYLPTTLTQIQRDISYIIMKIFFPDNSVDLLLGKERISVDSLLGPNEDESSSSSVYETLLLLTHQLKLTQKHVSLLVDHIVPKTLLLLDLPERRVMMSGKFVILDRILNQLLTMGRNPFDMLVIANSAQDIELIESIIMGKPLYYQNFSGSKLYEDFQDLPDLSKVKANKYTDKIRLCLITSSQLYNRYSSIIHKKPSHFDMIFSFDVNVDVENPGIEILRSGNAKIPILIPIVVASEEHIALKEQPPQSDFGTGPSQVEQAWKIKLVKQLLVNRGNWFEDFDEFFRNYYGTSMHKLCDWMINWKTKRFPFDGMRRFDENLELTPSHRQLIKELEHSYMDQDLNYKLMDFNYKSFREKLASLIIQRVEFLENRIKKIKSKELTKFKEKETIRQSEYDEDEEKMGENYRKLRKLNQELAPLERRVERVIGDLTEQQKEKQRLDERLEYLKRVTKEDGVEQRLEDQSEIKELLSQEFEALQTEYNKLTEEAESIRGEYQLKSTEALQWRGKFEEAKDKEIKIKAKIENPGAVVLPDLTREENVIYLQSLIKKLRAENESIADLFGDIFYKVTKDTYSVEPRSRTLTPSSESR